ncbi:hypothetical protein [Actinophytocola oryzae]|uniref:Uncharacterized protein n=1 Tax=Actinophytocola oryzae TaxID=502181 RepID=A0A4R7V3I6_9PSEU|nr:hypothetical protein [Actinophytocola oryzae]TDV43172.1 hypothetical protein CLV71_116106 [Actinophytocola oryzae]
MNGLKSFVTLQARLYEFLEQQDETTLQQLASGTAQLVVVGRDVPRPAPATHTTTPSDDPYQAAQDLPRLASAHDRRVYLTASGMTTEKLKRVAKLLGLTGYSNKRKAELTDLLAGRSSDQAEKPAGEPSRSAPPVPEAVDDSTQAEEQSSATAARPMPDTARPHVDAAAIASRLREIETEEEGAAYLRTQALDRQGLLAVAAELRLTRVDRLKAAELEKRMLKQAIGARRKFAGLRKW